MNNTCKVYNLTSDNLNTYQCGLRRLAANLYYYDFGYICIIPLLLIIIISIFGKFKGNYRWFILNQAIWDIIICSYYSCNNIMRSWVKPGISCPYLAKTYVTKSANWDLNLDWFTAELISNNIYSALFLLTTSRFIAIYFPLMYDRLTKSKRILSTFIIFYFITLFLNIYPIFRFFLFDKKVECIIAGNSSYEICNARNEFEKSSIYMVYQTLYDVFYIIQRFRAFILFFLSIIASVMIVWKIAKQAKFQLKHNRKDFIASLRIAIAIGLQILINSFSFIIDSYNRFLPQLIISLNLKIRIARANNAYNRNYEGYLDLRLLPEWFDHLDGLTADIPREMIVQLRILFEAFIVLGIMTGYREAIIDFIKFILKFTRYSFKSINNFMFRLNKAKVSETTVF